MRTDLHIDDGLAAGRECGSSGHVRAAVIRFALAVLSLAVLSAAAPPASSAQRRPRRPPTEAQVDQARARFGEGSAHYEAGRLNEALEAFLDAWRLVPGPDLAYNVARTYERMGDSRHGIEFYRQYLSHAAPDADARAAVERRIVELEAIARRQREQIITLPPTDDALTQEARTFFERGIAMFRRRRYEAAMAAFTAAYNFARLPEVIYNLAVTAERLERFQDAVDYYREYARSLPADGAERAMIDRQVSALRERARR